MLGKIKQLLWKAHEKINEKEAAKEALKIGTLRAGSSGALVDDQAFYTQCGRLAQARLLGFQSSPTQEMRLMFNGGLTLEDYLETRLKTNNIDYKKETSYELEVEGIFISGRPDFEILLDGEWVGIEVKSLASPFSVIKQRKNGFPFMKHLLQAATYAMLLDRKKWLVCIGHSFYVNQNGKKHNPDLVWYELTYNGKDFAIENESGKKVKLPFDKQAIISYYKEVKEKTEKKQLMSRPTELELNVDTYNRCNYCALKSACNQYDNQQLDFDTWLQKVTENKEFED